MISPRDSHNKIDLGMYYAILPSDGKQKYLDFYKDAVEVEKGFNYNSGTNDQWISVEEMRELIKKNVDSNFEPIQ
jgi:UDP-N-acetylglucosamine 4,6-dehydratase